MSGEHARLAPSAAGTWGPGGCPAYPRMSALYPEDEEGTEAREGTAAHWYVSEAIGGTIRGVGSLAPNGVPLTQEMLDCGEAFIESALADGELCDDSAVETRLVMSRIHADNWGTPDWFGVSYANKTIYLKDYKYGHRYVEVFENWQMVDYLMGVVEAYHINLRDGWSADVTIFQPRCFSNPNAWRNNWVVTGDRLIELAKMLKDAAIAASEPDAPMRTGKYCKDCEAAHACPALQACSENGIDLSLRGTPHELSLPHASLALSHVRAAIQRLEGMDAALTARVMADVRSGKTAPGWELTHGEGREKWTAPVDEVFALGDLMGVDVRKKPEPITPAQARKAGLDDTVISAYAGRAKGEAKLSPVDNVSARKAFGSN